MGKRERLAVPLKDLEAFPGRLRSIESRMNGTKKLFDQYRDDIGDGGVCDKLEDFESNWEDGRGDISKQLDGLIKMAEAVVREFDKVDTKLERELERNKRKAKAKDKAGKQAAGDDK